MNWSRVVPALALADFRERTRRFSFLATLLFTMYVGYAAGTGQISLRLGDYRGLYTSAWVGAMMSLIVTTFLGLVGFYIVKNAVDRDRQTGVGQILASTPTSRISYLTGKFASNFLVLGSMIIVLALGAMVMQFVVAEDRVFHPWALLSPFLLISLPATAIIAAFAVLFESVRWLRGGFGNVLWFFVWAVSASLPGFAGFPRSDPFGLWTVYRSLAPAAVATLPDYHGGFSLSIADKTARVFPGLHWEGIHWTLEEVLLRISWLVVAFALVALAAVFFDRFDSTRSHQSSRAERSALAPAVQAVSPSSAPEVNSSATVHLTPLPSEAHSSGFARIFLAELRVALKGYSWWWYAVALGLLVAQIASPLEISRGPLLTAAWIWPILIWSSLGVRESRFATQPLLFSCARILPRQLPAAWLASVFITVLLGAGTALRLALAAEPQAFFAWTVGALFVPSLALALGIWSGTSRFFEGLYTALWYVGPLNKVPGLDFTGVGSGSSAARFVWFYLLATMILCFSAYARRARQIREN